MQDDWRVSDKLTMNYGLRLEHESGLREADNKLVVGFDRTTASPLNVTIPAGIDPLDPTATRQVLGGLIYAGENGASEQTGNPPAVKISPRGGFAYSMNDKTVVRGGYGLFWAPWAYGANNSVGYSATTTLQQDTTIPITSIVNPFPSADRRVGQLARHAVGRQLGDLVRRSEQDRAVRAPVLVRHAARARRQPERAASPTSARRDGA